MPKDRKAKLQPIMSWTVLSQCSDRVRAWGNSSATIIYEGDRLLFFREMQWSMKAREILKKLPVSFSQLSERGSLQESECPRLSSALQRLYEVER